MGSDISLGLGDDAGLRIGIWMEIWSIVNSGTNTAISSYETWKSKQSLSSSVQRLMNAAEAIKAV